MSSVRQSILQCLTAFVNSRPGLEFANYGDVSAYRAELRQITKDRTHALELLAQVSWRESIDADALIRASQSAFSGRLTIKLVGESIVIDYCAGQYYPTEYRRAVCSVLASALWDYWRANGCATGDDIRKMTSARWHGVNCRAVSQTAISNKVTL
jgi:hypothetical protein